MGQKCRFFLFFSKIFDFDPFLPGQGEILPGQYFFYMKAQAISFPTVYGGPRYLKPFSKYSRSRTATIDPSPHAMYYQFLTTPIFENFDRPREIANSSKTVRDNGGVMGYRWKALRL